MLESLVRLSESHAKFMNEEEVCQDDAFIAIILMETTVNSGNNLVINIDKVFTDINYYNKIKACIKDSIHALTINCKINSAILRYFDD